MVTYHTGRLEGSGGQEGLGHGQAQERNQERKGPHGCRLPVDWLVAERTCVSGDWVCVGGESELIGAGKARAIRCLLGLG